MRILQFSVLSAAVFAETFANDPNNMVWPRPARVSFGKDSICISPKAWRFVASGDCGGRNTLEEPQLRLSGAQLDLKQNSELKPGTFCADLDLAFERYRGLIFPHQVTAAGSNCLSQATVKVENASFVLDFGVDESYELSVEAKGISIAAKTVFGAYRALESFSQLVRFDFQEKAYKITNSPWSISDEPRFNHRELLVDTSRHFLPIATLESIINSMSFAKANVLHWHIEDDQSFPFCSERLPEFCKTAPFSGEEMYTVEDVKHLVEFARLRGVRIVPEIDLPGHTSSWCKAYPEICVASGSIITPANPETIQVIKSLLTEFRQLFPDSFIHLGGDEVDLKQWTQDSKTKSWLEVNNMTETGAYLFLVKAAHDIALDLNWNPVGWSEIWSFFRTELNPSSVLEKWRPEDSLLDMTRNGYRSIYANSAFWYLDHLNTNWETMYNTEPCEGLGTNECAFVIGGGGEMWGETADPSDVQQTIWPRFGAIAERLWSPAEFTKNSTAALPRLHEFRCLLTRRGIEAAPLLNPDARHAPPGPGSCLEQ